MCYRSERIQQALLCFQWRGFIITLWWQHRLLVAHWSSHNTTERKVTSHQHYEYKQQPLCVRHTCENNVRVMNKMLHRGEGEQSWHIHFDLQWHVYRIISLFIIITRCQNVLPGHYESFHFYIVCQIAYKMQNLKNLKIYRSILYPFLNPALWQLYLNVGKNAFCNLRQ